MPRTLTWGTLALALLAAAVLSLRRGAAPSAESRPLASFAPDSLVRLERSQAGETLALVKKAGRWIDGAGAPANAEACARLARAAQALTLGAIVSDDPASYESYGLAESQAVRLKVFPEGSLTPALDAYLGRAAFGETLYARLAREAPVRLANGMPLETLSLPATGYALKVTSSQPKFYDTDSQ